MHVLFELLACTGYACKVIFNLWLQLKIGSLEIDVKHVLSMLGKLRRVHLSSLFPDVICVRWWIDFSAALSLSSIFLSGMHDKVLFIFISFRFLKRFTLKCLFIIVAVVQLIGYGLISVLTGTQGCRFPILSIFPDYSREIFQVIALSDHWWLISTGLHDGRKTLACQAIVDVLLERKKASGGTRHAQTDFIRFLFRRNVPSTPGLMFVKLIDHEMMQNLVFFLNFFLGWTLVAPILAL